MRRVAVVTGASRGIGRAVAERLTRDGVRVVVGYARSAEQAEQVVAGITAGGGEAVAIRADLSKPDEIPRLFEAATERWGRLDILVNNAAVYEGASLEDSDAAHYSAVFEPNVRGVLLASREAASRMSEGGRIINLSSGAAAAGVPGGGVYGASKAAVEALTRSHAAELGIRGITVNAVAPGITETDMLPLAVPAPVQQVLVANTALRRLGRPEDIAEVVAFLVSDAASWITGQVIAANGGLRG